MHAEKDWRWDDPGTSTTAVSETEGRGEARRTTVGEAAVHDFATTAAEAADAVEVRQALAAAVRWASDGPSASLKTDDGVPSRGCRAIPIRARGGRVWGRIELVGDDDEDSRDPIEERRLETIAALAALAFERLERQPPSSSPESTATEAPAMHDAVLLSAVLPFAIGQARRHQEPLAILLIAIDQLRGIRRLLGTATADHVVDRVGAKIACQLRSSDLVGRLDDDRLMAILPRAELADAHRIGEKLVRKVAAETDLSGLPIPVSITVGAAETPRDADTLGGLLDAADAALSEALHRPSRQTTGRP